MQDYKPETLREIDDEILRICSQGLSRQDNDARLNPDGLTIPVEVTDNEIFEQLDALEMKRDKKVENIGYVLLGQDEKIDNIDKEIKRLQTWLRIIKGRKKSLMWYCVMEMLRTGIRKVTGKFIEITVCKNSQVSVEYAKDARGKTDFSRIDPRFVYEEESEPVLKVDKDEAIRHFNNTGKAPDGIRIQDGHHLRIK